METKTTEKIDKVNKKSGKEGVFFILLAIFLFSIPTIVAYNPNSLEGYLLVANKVNKKDKNNTADNISNVFDKTVILITKHDRNHAVGFVVNKPIAIKTAKEMYDEFYIRPAGRFTNIFSTVAYADSFLNKKLEKTKISTYWGGPLENEDDKAVIIFEKSKKYTRKHIKNIKNTDVQISTDMQALNKIILKGNDHKSYRILVGYAGWGYGQLDQEVKDGLWLVASYDKNLIFSSKPEKIWEELYDKITTNKNANNNEAEKKQ